MRHHNSKHVIILANSIKKRARCIAGKVVTQGPFHYNIGDWIRPITKHDEGAVFEWESRLEDGAQPQVMQFVEVPLLGHSADPVQPENWYILTGVKWKSVDGDYQKPQMTLLRDAPDSLWIDNQRKNDRIRESLMKRRRGTPSLYIIRVPMLVVSFSWASGKQRRRAEFSYNGVNYDFPLTDPVFEEKYSSWYPATNAAPYRFYANNQRPCDLCVSLTPAFHGNHYKVVATVFEE